MAVSTEQALRMVRGGVTWEFPPIPGDLDIWAAQGGQGFATETDFAAGPGASYRKPVTALPAGFVKCWDLPANGSISVTLPVAGMAGGTLRLSFRIWNRTTGVENYSAGFSVTWESSGTPLPDESDFMNVVPSRAGTFSNLGAWTICSFDIEVPATATSASITVTGERQNQRTYLLGVTVAPVAERETVTWGCGAAKDGHLEGLWTLPQMQGEILENVLYGGGLAPANPTWGPRPVTYVLYLTGLSRPAVMNELKRFTGFLASGPVTVWHHAYGICENGFLAAPPEVEWLNYVNPLVKVVLTLTFLDPRIWSILRDRPDVVRDWAVANEGTARIDNTFTFWSAMLPTPWGSDPGPGFDLVNNGAASEFPIFVMRSQPDLEFAPYLSVALWATQTPAAGDEPLAKWYVKLEEFESDALHVLDTKNMTLMVQTGQSWRPLNLHVLQSFGDWAVAPGQTVFWNVNTDSGAGSRMTSVGVVLFVPSM